MDSVETTEAPEILTCTKRLERGGSCQNPRADQDPTATNRHCLEHRREQHRRHFLMTIDQQRGKGYTKGVEAMRRVLVREFRAFGDSSFPATEVVELILRAPGPSREPDDLELRPEIDPDTAAAGKLPDPATIS